MGSRSLGFTFLSLVAVILLLVMTIVTSWYSFKNDGITTVDSNGTMVNYTVHAKVDLFLIGQKYEKIVKDENGTEISHETITQNWNEVGSEFSHIKRLYIDILGTICGGIFLFIVCTLFILAKLFRAQSVRKIAKVLCCGRNGKVVVVLFVWAAVFLTIFSGLMLLRQPSAFNSDFDSYNFGIPCGDGKNSLIYNLTYAACSEYSGSAGDLKWGPGVGWYLCWIGFALGIIIGILVSVNRKRFQYHRIQ